MPNPAHLTAENSRLEGGPFGEHLTSLGETEPNRTYQVMLKAKELKSLARHKITSMDRLEIRRFNEGDFDQYAEYHQNKDVYRYLYQDTPAEDALHANFSAAIDCKFSSDGDSANLAVIRKSDDAVIGEVILKLSNISAFQGEVGYIFNPRFSGNGYATEAVRAIVDVGFDDVGFHRIFARLDPKNRGSVGVVERLQFRREAHLLQNDIFNGVWGDEYIYAILADEWRSHRG